MIPFIYTYSSNNGYPNQKLTRNQPFERCPALCNALSMIINYWKLFICGIRIVGVTTAVDFSRQKLLSTLHINLVSEELSTDIRCWSTHQYNTL